MAAAVRGKDEEDVRRHLRLGLRALLDIALLAVQTLDPERRAVLDVLRREARAGDEQRLCGQGADAGQSRVPQCIDWAALPGIAGDHSCSSLQMLETVRKADWILLVADIGAQLKVELARIPVTAPPGASTGRSDLVMAAKRQLASATVLFQLFGGRRHSLRRVGGHAARESTGRPGPRLLARPADVVRLVVLQMRPDPNQPVGNTL